LSNTSLSCCRVDSSPRNPAAGTDNAATSTGVIIGIETSGIVRSLIDCESALLEWWFVFRVVWISVGTGEAGGGVGTSNALPRICDRNSPSGTQPSIRVPGLELGQYLG
jgi:hypothetical protein